jgi:Bacterial Ig domain
LPWLFAFCPSTKVKNFTENLVEEMCFVLLSFLQCRQFLTAPMVAKRTATQELIWPQQESVMTTFKWICLGLVLMVLLSACGGNTTKTAKLTLTPGKTQVSSGEKVTLKVTIDEGAEDVASVDFAVKSADPFAKDVKAGTDGSYNTESAVLTATTTFVATAKDTSGKVIGTSGDVTVTVSTVPQPNAEPKTVTTLAGVQVVGGGTPTGLAVTTDKLVFANGTPRLKGAGVGGTAVVNPDGTFTFTPDSGATSGSFEYEVVSGTLIDTATVTINITALPVNTVIVDDLTALTAATATGSTATTILVNGTITCGAADCVSLQPGQKLVGAGVVEGVTLSGVAKIDATVSVDESTPPQNNNITVIKLAADTTIEGLEISGRDIFTAINGVAVNLRQPGSPADNPTASTITVKNVKITGPTSDSPFKIEFTGPPTEDFEAYYDLNIDALTFAGVAGKPIGFSAFEDLELKNSTIDISADAGGETGISVRAYSGPTTALVENVVITSAKGGAGFSPLEIGQSSAGGVLTATVKNTTVTFADDIDKENAAFPFYFNFGNPSPGVGKIIVEGSTGNTSNTTSNDPIRLTGGAAKIDGEIELNGATISIP